MYKIFQTWSQSYQTFFLLVNQYLFIFWYYACQLGRRGLFPIRVFILLFKNGDFKMGILKTFILKLILKKSGELKISFFYGQSTYQTFILNKLLIRSNKLLIRSNKLLIQSNKLLIRSNKHLYGQISFYMVK